LTNCTFSYNLISQIKLNDKHLNWSSTFFADVGPEFPFYEEANCTYNGPHTCSTDLDNIVDVYYFDHTDEQSCRDQVEWKANTH